MSEQEQPQQEEQQETTTITVTKTRKRQKHQSKPKKIQQKQKQQQISMLDYSHLGDEERQLEEALNDVRQRRQEHERFFVNAKADPEKVEKITQWLKETLPMLKENGKPPKLWERLMHIIMVQEINSPDKALLSTEFGQAIKNVYDDKLARVKQKNLQKMSGWVKAMFGTAEKHGFQIKSIDEGKVKRYFWIVKDEDREKYKERLGFRVEKDVKAIDTFELRSEKIKREQEQQRPLLVAVGDEDEKQEDDELESKEEENEDEQQE